MNEMQNNELLKFKKIVNTANYGVVIIGLDFKISYINKYFAELHGYAPDDLVGKHIKKLHNEEQLLELDSILKTLEIEKEMSNTELWHVHEMGYIFPVLMNGIYIEFDNKEKSYALIGVDLAEQKMTEKELDNAKLEAEAATKAKADFLASMSHEIRTPMNGIIGMTNLLLDTSLNDEQLEFVEIIKTSADSLLTIINDILDFSKIESQKLELEEHPFSIRNCIEDVFDLLSTKATSKKIELLYLIKEDVPSNIVGDITRVRQVLVNLVNNALKFTEKGHVLIEVSKLEVNEDIVKLKFSVQDTGIGIPKNKLDILFEAFSQVDSSTTRKYGGTGLGLAISKQLSELMGGKIWVESVIGKGSDFSFTINTKETRDEIKEGKTKEVNLKNKKILIVDDNPVNRKILEVQTRNWNLEPILFESGFATLASIDDNYYDIAILDLHMPGMDGLELAQLIHAKKPELPLILLSSSGDITKQVKEESPIGTFLLKPVKHKYLYNSIKSNLEGNQIKKKKDSKKIEDEKLLNSSLKILVAEDNAINQKLILKVLEKMGYKADVAANGLEVIDALHNKQYEIIFMDVQMPEMNGLDATKEIRKIWDEADQPAIIAMTANAMDGDKEMCLEAGMDDYISKPIHVGEVKKALIKYGEKTDNSVETFEPAKKPIGNRNVVDVLNTEMIDSIFMLDGGNFISELFNSFADQFPIKVEELYGFIKKDDFTNLELVSHEVKGSGANIGARSLSEICYTIEQKAKENVKSNLADDMKALLEMFETTKIEFEKYISDKTRIS